MSLLDNRKNLINLKKEQSTLIEEAETFRQLILGAS
jgi:hypothetical protein